MPDVRELRELVDVSEDQGQLYWSLNATVVLNGSTASLVQLGEQGLRRLACGQRPTAHAEANAYDATRPEALAQLFELLGLDARLRHHRRALQGAEKAQVVRSVAGELQRALAETSGGEEALPWCRALLREMGDVLLDMHEDQVRCFGGPPPPLRSDAKLAALLRSGAAREILERLHWLQEQEAALGDQTTLTLAAVLPRLNTMRLLVFSRALTDLLSEPARLPQRRQELATTVVRGILASDLTALPIEIEEQLQEAQLSPYLDDLDRQALLELMAPRAPTPRPRSPWKLPETTKVAEPWERRVPREVTRRGAELRALRRPAAPLAEPRPAARPRRPMVESWGIGLPGQYEELETERFRVSSLPTTPREEVRPYPGDPGPWQTYLSTEPYGRHTAPRREPSLSRAASAFQRLAKRAELARWAP